MILLERADSASPGYLLRQEAADIDEDRFGASKE